MKFFSFNRSQAIILTTVLVLGTLTAYYIFFYLPANEKIIQERRFRSLQNMDKNVHVKIDNSISLLDNLLDSYFDPSKTTGRDNYVKSSQNFSLSPIDSTFGSKLPPDWPQQKDSLRNFYVIDINKSTSKINLTLYKEYVQGRDAIANSLKKGDTVNLRVRMQFSFDQFIKPLLQKDIFDQYVIFSDDKPVYETFPAGIEKIAKDSLRVNGIAASGMRQFNISGTDYKMFLQPVNISSKEAWTIAGLLSVKQYHKERNQLPSRLLILLLIILVGALLLFPWIRLFHVGNKDRLTVGDGILSVIVAMLFMSLLFLTFFRYNVNYWLHKDTDSKEILANKISAAFTTEVDSIYDKLRKYDDFLNRHEKVDTDIINLDTTPRLYPGGEIVDSLLADTLKQLIGNSSIRHLFWLDQDGNEIRNWNTNNFIPPHGNFKNRSYFRRIIENDPYYITGYPATAPDISKTFFLEPVISRTSAGFTTILSMPSGQKDLVACVSFKVRSVENVLLPPGYMIAMIDKDGQVLYHSDTARNLNENLLEEFTGEGRRMLIGSLQSRTETIFTTGYFNREYGIRIDPVPYLPYSIVVFEDIGHKETRDMQIFSFSFVMLLLFFLFLALELFTIFFVSAKRSFFKRQLFNTGWVGPRESCKKEYLLSTTMNMMVIVLLIVFSRYASFLVYLFILLLSATITSLFLIGLFEKRYRKDKRTARKYKIDAARSLIIIIVLINFASLFILDTSWDQLGIFALYELLVLAIGLLIYDRSEKIMGTVSKWIHTPLSVLLKKILFPLFWKWDHIKSFSLTALTRLIITSGIPVVFFYVASYNYEQIIGIRYKQTEYAEQLIRKLKTDRNIPSQPPGMNGIYKDSFWISGIDTVDKADLPDAKYSDQEQMTRDLLGNFRIYITREAIAENDFYKSVSAGDSLFRYSHFPHDAFTKDAASVTYMKMLVPGKYLKISSRDLSFAFPSLFGRWPFWIMLIACLVIFYFVLYFVIRKLFALKIPDLSLWKELDEQLLADGRINKLVFVLGLPGSEKKRRILEKINSGIILSVNNARLSYDDTVPSANKEVVIVDLIRTPESGNEEEKKEWEKYTKEIMDANYKLIIVNHFEYNIQDASTNQYKLNFLEKLMQELDVKIIILSTIHPVAFLDSIYSPNLKEQPKDVAPGKSVPGQDLERWHVLLGHYRIVLFPLGPVPFRDRTIQFPQNKIILKMKRRKGEPSESYQWSTVSCPMYAMPLIINKDQPETEVINLTEAGEYEFKLTITDKNGKTEIEKKVIVVNPIESHDSILDLAIREETLQGHFLSKMKPITESAAYIVKKELDARNEQVNPDEMIFKLQVTSHYFYMYVWQSLTKEEKFLLYDLAEDDLVNSFDDYNLSMLIAKGVVVRYDGTLRIFNKGFRNFILTAIGNSEVMKIKDQISDKGNWGKLKGPLTIIVIAILAFLMTSQEETYLRLITYIGGIGTAIAAIFNLLSKAKGSSNSG